MRMQSRVPSMKTHQVQDRAAYTAPPGQGDVLPILEEQRLNVRRRRRKDVFQILSGKNSLHQVVRQQAKLQRIQRLPRFPELLCAAFCRWLHAPGEEIKRYGQSQSDNQRDDELNHG